MEELAGLRQMVLAIVEIRSRIAAPIGEFEEVAAIFPIDRANRIDIGRREFHIAEIGRQTTNHGNATSSLGADEPGDQDRTIAPGDRLGRWLDPVQAGEEARVRPGKAGADLVALGIFLTGQAGFEMTHAGRARQHLGDRFEPIGHGVVERGCKDPVRRHPPEQRAIVPEQDRAIDIHVIGRAGDIVLLHLHRQIDEVSPMQQMPPAEEEIVKADANGDAAILAGQADHVPDDAAGMGIGAIRAGEYDQLGRWQGSATRELAAHFEPQQAERKRPVEHEGKEGEIERQ